MPPATLELSSNGPDLVVIFIAIVGGILLIALAIGIFLVLRKSRKTANQPPPSRFGHKHTISDASAASLLHPRIYWKSREDAYPQNYYPGTFLDDVQKRNGSTNSIATVKPIHDERSSVPVTDNTPFLSDARYSPHHSPKHDLPPLTIPPTRSYVPSYPDSVISNSPYASPPSPAGSDSSESLYSQASARSHLSMFLPQPMPPMIPQYSYVEEETAPARSDTIVIGKLLKERAKRNPNRISRTVSRIERMGSIKDAADGSGDEDGAAQPPHRRTKSKRKTATPLVPMSSLAEGSESGGSPPSSSRGFAAVAPTPLPVTLLNASWVDKESSPPLRPYSLLPPRTSSLPQQQSQHQHSQSLDGHPQTRDQDTSQGWYAHAPPDPGLPKVHVRQYSAERMLDVTHQPGRKVSTHGLIEGYRS